MKEFKGLELTIDGGNAAFGLTPEDAMDEISRIVLGDVLPFLSTAYSSVPMFSGSPHKAGKDGDGHPEGLDLRDINGNTVGRIEVAYDGEAPDPKPKKEKMMAENHEVLTLLEHLKRVLAMTYLTPPFDPYTNYTDEDRAAFKSAVDLINEYAGHGITGEGD